MRILIADDNIALQEVLTEVVSGAGHTAEAVSSADAALSSIGSFRPDLIFLDIDMPDGEGFALLDKMRNHAPPINTPVTVIRSWNRQIPQDISAVKHHMEKPFSTADVLECIKLMEGLETNEETDVPAAHAEARQKTPRGTLTEKGVSFGRSYVMFQRGPDAVHDLVSLFDKEGHDVLIITTRKKKTIIERFRSKNVKSLTMTIRLFGGHFNMYGLGTMIDNVEEFIGNSGRPVVAFDDLNKIIDRNGMNSALAAVHQLVTKKYEKDTTFLVSVDPAGFTTKDKEILLNHMAHYNPTGE